MVFEWFKRFKEGREDTHWQTIFVNFPLWRPTAMHLSLKGFLRTPETHHEAHQSTTSAVQQTAENNLSSPPGKIHHPCPNYQRWHTALLLLQGNQLTLKRSVTLFDYITNN
ncbi:hypothetical protein J6590_089901 [Homalodisca vitripennis]|nr:hypothetical protein J6590_100870 [Homalodisca vitripennis]KAG8329295.1 hypothetical protein J6590_089901 [Homalodisca vitripennis]